MLNVLTNLEYEKIEVYQREIIQPDRPQYSSKFSKFLFFLLREGLFRTLNKIRSKKFESKIRSKYLTHVKAYYKGEWVHNISIQSQKNEKYLIIRNVFFRNSNFTLDNISDDVALKNFIQYCTNPAETDNSEYNGTFSIPLKNNHTPSNNFDEGVFLFGLGDYARVYIAPHIKKLTLIACVDHNPESCRYFTEKIKFRYSFLLTKQSFQLIKETAKPLVIVATYHSDHTNDAVNIYNHNKESLIFIEKPPCVTLSDLDELISLYNKKANIEIGFNRRYIPWNKRVKNEISGKKVVLTFSIKEVLINYSHWYYWNNQGTRITGNLVHWIDLSNYWIDSNPIELTLLNNMNEENIAFSILYENGSVANFTVSDAGNSLRGVQENIEIRTDDITININDYLKYTQIKPNGRRVTNSNIIRDKGHDNMYSHIVKVFKGNEMCLYKATDLVRTTVTTYYASKMFTEGIRNLVIENDVKLFLKKIKLYE